MEEVVDQFTSNAAAMEEVETSCNVVVHQLQWKKYLTFAMEGS